MPRRFLVPAFSILTLGAGLAVPIPSAAQSHGVILAQWEASPHARSMDTPEERERMNRAGCARCHTAQGFHEVTLGGRESTAPYADAVGLTCQACHTEGETPNEVGALRAGAPGDACRGCHDELVTNRPDDLSWCSQWGIFQGTGGAETPGGVFEAAAHQGLEDGCVSCHMAPAAPGVDQGVLGGHTFRVKTKGLSPEAFNPAACVDCHGSMTLQRMTSSQANVRALLATLAGMLPQRPDPEDPAGYVPRFPADPSLDEVQARAAFNYWLVEKDGSLGVHNPVYTRALLERSIALLELGASGGHHHSESPDPEEV